MWQIGELVDGRYRVTGVHEHGGMGVVHRIRHLEWGVDLAVKSPRPELLRSAEEQAHFVAEAETWVSLGLHPHVCNCHYVRVLDGVPRVFAEYVPGGSLHEWISDGRLYAGDEREISARILDIAIQTAWGLDHAHGQGLVHRDVKPANVLLDGQGGAVTAKITDFGLARARDLAATLSADAPPDASLLVPGGGGMTPRYASPEQAAGEPVGRRTDVYSFGVSVLEMCTGEVTWMAGPVAGAALTGYRSGEVAGATALPPALGDLLARCLRNTPAARPKSLADVAAVLSDIYRSVTGEAYPRPEPVPAGLLSDELNNRGVSLLDLDRHAEADEAFAQALTADPQNVRARYNHGLARWRRGAVTDVALLDEIEALRKDKGGPWEARYALAQIHLERGDLGTARGLLDTLAREHPDEPQIREALRRLRSGEIVDARCTTGSPVPWPERPPGDDFLLDRHEDRVPLALTPDGRFLAVGGWDGKVRVWDTRTGQWVWTLKGHRRPVLGVDLTPDGRCAVAVCRNGTVRFWKPAKGRFGGALRGRLLYTGPHPPAQAGDGRPRLGDVTVRITPDGRFVLHTDRDGVFRVWDVHSGEERILDQAAAGMEQLVEVTADGSRALSVRSHGRLHAREAVVRLWDLPGGRCLREFAGHKPAVRALCFGADGRFAATSSSECIRVWDLADGHCVRTLPQSADTLALGAEARLLLSGSRYDAALRLWDLESGACVRTFRAHRGGTSVVRLDADVRWGFSAGQDQAVRRWRLPGTYRGAPLLSRPRAHVELNRLGARVDGLVAEAERAMADGRFPTALERMRQARAVTGYEREPRVMSAWWALGRRSVRTELRAVWSSRAWRTGELTAVELSADGRIGASGERDGTVRLWDLVDGRCLAALEGHGKMVESLCLSVDGRWVLSSSRDRTVRVWDVTTGACRHVLTVSAHEMERSCPVRFSADGRQIMVGGGAGRVQWWDLETGEPRRDQDLRKGNSDSMCLADDGRLAATVTHSGLELGDVGNGRVLHDLRNGVMSVESWVRAVALSADGRYAVTGADTGLQLRDTATGHVVRTFEGPPTKGTHTVRMTADGHVAVSGGYWSDTALWDVRSGRCVRLLDGHERGVGSLAMTPDGRFVLTGQGGALRLWELDWELTAHDVADWDDGAAPYLEAFLSRQGPQWTDEDFDTLLRRLQDVGYGWLRAEGVRARLDRMSAA